VARGCVWLCVWEWFALYFGHSLCIALFMLKSWRKEGGGRERKGGVHVEGCVWLALRYHIIDGEIFGLFRPF
jgi:hypothetical protein